MKINKPHTSLPKQDPRPGGLRLWDTDTGLWANSNTSLYSVERSALSPHPCPLTLYGFTRTEERVVFGRDTN